MCIFLPISLIFFFVDPTARFGQMVSSTPEKRAPQGAPRQKFDSMPEMPDSTPELLSPRQNMPEYPTPRQSSTPEFSTPQGAPRQNFGKVILARKCWQGAPGDARIVEAGDHAVLFGILTLLYEPHNIMPGDGRPGQPCRVGHGLEARSGSV